jgi:hypothetical protein
LQRSAAKLEEELQGLTGLLGDGLAAEGDGLAAEGDGLAAEGDGLAAEGEGLRHAKPRAAKRLDLVVDDLDAVLEATARPWNADGHYEHLKLSAVLHVKQYRALKAIATNLLPHVRDSSAVTSADGPGSQPELNEEAARAVRLRLDTLAHSMRLLLIESADATSLGPVEGPALEPRLPPPPPPPVLGGFGGAARRSVSSAKSILG